jgi:potassium efflux system protein
MFKNKRILLLTILIVLSVSTAFVPVSSYPKGSTHTMLQIIKGLLLTLSWMTFYYFLKKAFFERYKSVYKKDLPRIILFITRIIMFLGTVLSIIVFVLGQSIFSIVAVGGLVSAGLTFALGELILDAFSGVILETESPFEVGDWVKTHDDNEGRVMKINWRTVILEHHDGYLVVVPHRKIAQGFTNYSKPHKMSWDIVEVTLDHSIPVERAERILRAGLLNVPSIYQNKCDVTAIKAHESGIIYELRYMIPDRMVKDGVKHDVLQAVTEHLHLYKLRLSETLGEYAITQGGKPYQEETPLTIENLIEKVDFLKSLPKAVGPKLSQNANRLVFGQGEQIVKEGDKGQSMFLIGEGMVEISINYKNNAGHKKEKKLFRMGYPEYFGEMALLLNEKRSATVTAMMNTVVYEISQDVLKHALKDNPKAFEKMKKSAIAKREENKRTKSQMERLKEKKKAPSKGLLTNFKKFFK